MASGKGSTADTAFPDLPSTPVADWPARGPQAHDPAVLAEAADVWRSSSVSTLSDIRVLYADDGVRTEDATMPHHVVILTGRDSAHIQRIALLTEPDDPARSPRRLRVRDDEPAPYEKLTGAGLPDRPLDVTGSIVFVIRAIHGVPASGTPQTAHAPPWIGVSLAEPGYGLYADEPGRSRPADWRPPPPVEFAETGSEADPVVEDYVYYHAKLIGIRYLDAKLPR